MRRLSNLISIVLIIGIVLLGFYIADNFYKVNNFSSDVLNQLIYKNLNGNLESNEYMLGNNYNYIQQFKKETVSSKKDIINLFYTFLDNGYKRYTFKCDSEYLSCINDAKDIIEDNTLLSNVANFVHPFNNFNQINTEFAASGKITLIKSDRYSESDIINLNTLVDEIYTALYDPNRSARDNIKIFHDYIIDNSVYDSSNKNGISIYKSSYAMGPLFEGYGVCSGYSDALSLFLYKLNVPNIRVSSKTHTWNLVYLDGAWLHLDSTWDDPITSNGTNIIEYKYFLIPYEKLKTLDTTHIFDEIIYHEAL